ncbi:MAG TPA: DUF2946 family protein [Rhizomicrobium sp.]
MDRVRCKGRGWQALTWVFALAFALQSYATQTHIHGSPQASGAAGYARLAGGAPHDKAPVGNDLTDCPFCQAIVHAGAFFAPAAQAPLPPFLVVERIDVFAHPKVAGVTTAHGWQSRAPPQA